MKELTASLSVKSLKQLQKDLKEYKKEIERKNKAFVVKLLREGIKVARANTGAYAGYIVFTQESTQSGSKSEGSIVATNGKTMIRTWKQKDGTMKVAEVSPILMAEFGSGWLADVRSDVAGVGQGTFPDQTHAADPYGWWWKDEDDIWHHSIGEVPNYPMYYAAVSMQERIEQIAREVFNS